MRHYYATYNWIVSEQNPGYGFENGKRALAFISRKERNAFVAERRSYDFSCKAIERREAEGLRRDLCDFPCSTLIFKTQKISYDTEGVQLYVEGDELL